MKTLQASFWLFLAISLSALSCGLEPVNPAEPQLTYKDYRTNGNDSLRVMFEFTDGDGDIGVDPAGTDYNLLLTLYYRRLDGNFYVASNLQGDSLIYPCRIGELPYGQNGLEGEIHADINAALISYDTIQFNAFLLDQAQHKSAVVRTGDIILQ